MNLDYYPLQQGHHPHHHAQLGEERCWPPFPPPRRGERPSFGVRDRHVESLPERRPQENLFVE